MTTSGLLVASPFTDEAREQHAFSFKWRGRRTEEVVPLAVVEFTGYKAGPAIGSRRISFVRHHPSGSDEDVVWYFFIGRTNWPDLTVEVLELVFDGRANQLRGEDFTGVLVAILLLEVRFFVHHREMSALHFWHLGIARLTK